MIVKLLTEQRLEFLSLTGGCISWSKSTFVKMPNCWNAHVTAHMVYHGTQKEPLQLMAFYLNLQLCFKCLCVSYWC